MQMFATVEDYVELYGAVTDESVLSAKLRFASVAVEAALRAEGIDPSATPCSMADALVCVTCSVANRIMPSATVDPGATSYMTTAGPYMSQVTLGSPYGTPKLLPSELAMLGIGGSRGRVLRPSVRPGGAHPCCPWDTGVLP